MALEGRVRQTQALPPPRAGRDGLLGEVDAGEPAGRKRLRHHVDRMTTAATEVGDVGAGAQPLRQPVDQRQHHVDQRGVEHLAALLRHQRVESRKLAVGQPAALAEAADDLLLDLAEQRKELGHQGEVVRPGRAGQHAARWAGSE